MKIVYKIEEFARQVKFAWQRVFRGYDDTAYWALDDYLATMLVPIFEWYRDNDPHSMLKEMKGKEPVYYGRLEQRDVYDKIITAFRIIRDENIYTEYQNKQIAEGLQLFVRHFKGFWT